MADAQGLARHAATPIVRGTTRGRPLRSRKFVLGTRCPAIRAGYNND